MVYERFAGIAAILCVTCNPVAGQQLNFESLPGVTASPGSAFTFEDETPGDKTECTTAFEVVGTESNVPKRVYKCTRGNITVTSETPPPGY